MYINGKHRNYKDIRNMKQQRVRYFEICSEYTSNCDIQPTPCHHTHNSSKNYRINAPLDVCASTPHSCKIEVRYLALYLTTGRADAPLTDILETQSTSKTSPEQLSEISIMHSELNMVILTGRST